MDHLQVFITCKFDIYRLHFKHYLFCQPFSNYHGCFKSFHHLGVSLSHPDIIMHVIHFKLVKTFLNLLYFIKINRHLLDRLINPPHLNPAKFIFENGYFPNLYLNFRHIYFLLILLRLKSRFMRYRIKVILI